MRIAIPTSQNTQVMIHECRALCAAFTRLGHDARLVLQPSDMFDADAVVTVNWMRDAAWKKPWLTWVQDWCGWDEADQTPDDIIVASGVKFQDAMRKLRYYVEDEIVPMACDTDAFNLTPATAYCDTKDVDIAFVCRLNNPVMPVRLVNRCNALNLAIAVAKKRNWTLGIYGPGWKEIPEYAKYWRGDLGTPEMLKACYQDVPIHIHTNETIALHSRPLECIASGGECFSYCDEVIVEDYAHPLIHHFSTEKELDRLVVAYKQAKEMDWWKLKKFAYVQNFYSFDAVAAKFINIIQTHLRLAQPLA